MTEGSHTGVAEGWSRLVCYGMSTNAEYQRFEESCWSNYDLSKLSNPGFSRHGGL